jgi:hypothetical protein
MENVLQPPHYRRMRTATSVAIDPMRFREFWWRRRTPLNAVGPMVGRSSGLGSVIAAKGSAGYYTLDEIASEISMHVDQLIFEIGTDEERERTAVV